MKRGKGGVILVLVLLLRGSLSAAETKFSLIVSEGFGSIKVGDLNTTLSSINSAYDPVREAYSERCVGEILPLPTKFKDWEAELRWNAWGRLSVGIALSAPLRFYQKSFVTYTIIESGLTQTENDTWTSEIHVSAPVKFNLFYSLPVIPKVNLIANGGIVYYRARIEQTWQWQFRYPDAHSALGRYYIDAKGKQIGYHCEIALEYDLNERVSIILAGVWRFSKIKSFDGSVLSQGDTFDKNGNLVDSGSISEEGVLYHYIGDDYSIPNSRHEKLVLTSLTPPWFGVDYPSDIRKAFLDLGGSTFRIGLKIGLF